MGVTGGHANAGEPSRLEPLDEPVPAAFGLAVGQMQPEEFSLSIRPDVDANHDGGGSHRVFVTDLDLQCIEKHERVRLPVERALRPGVDLLI